MDTIYLDHNATTPLCAEAADALRECQASCFANPSSQHALGRRSRQRLEVAREVIGRLLGARLEERHGDRLIFTSGGTEANNLALLGGLRHVGSPPRSQPPEAILSAIEHPSILSAGQELARQGWRVMLAPAGQDGVVRLDALRELLSPATRLVSLMLANNETGIVQPVAEVAALCRQTEVARGLPAGSIAVHTDAVQAAGKIEISFRDLGVAAMTVAAHKFHGPLGVGALLLRPEYECDAISFGGVQQGGLRPGTEGAPLAAGMQAALSAWSLEKADRASRMLTLRDRFERQLRTAYPQVCIVGEESPRLPHVTCAAFRGLDRQALLLALDLAGVACSTGSACASGSSEPSPVLRAMGCPAEIVASALRFSLGAQTTAAEIDAASERIASVTRRMRGAA